NGYADLLVEKVRNGMQKDAKEIQRAAHRATALTSQLLAFSRKQILQPRVIKLGSLIVAMQEMLQRLIGEDIDLTIRSTEDEGLVLADPGRIEQVVMNLAVNARDAMPLGGVLTIETSNVVLDKAYCHLHPEIHEGEYVLLAMSDNGHGMDQSILDRIFEPFFTTKEKGKGTGLGLATVYGIVKQSNGFVFCYSETGKGTTFKIYLPRSHEENNLGASHPESMSHLKGGAETILLVEDDDGVRGLAKSILSGAGYAVIAARTGFEALAALPGRSGRIDLLITDVVMPSMNGPEVAEQVTARCLGIKVVYMSGYTENSIVHHGVLDKGVQLVQKPFSAAGLLRTVREVLDSPVAL
ncbi:MAG TPA: ATP-binding protein, partial [Spirochaetia bacterium]|nr:ATP-binding protein [Spirochaetia bacterium]